ncbi:29710_t:CDS:2, partial [Racocetra persica]
KRRWFICASPLCDYEVDRDINAAHNILYKAQTDLLVKPSEAPTSISGVATLKKYFNNPDLAPARNLVNCQPVIRTDDLANINAQSYHQTLFEMLETNFWSMGNGPCGPNTEIYFDFHPEKNVPKNIEELDNKRFIEICNVVFPEFYQKGEEYLPLAEKCVDTGAGLERIAMVLQGKTSTFEIDL